jgi:hypothetical protein
MSKRGITAFPNSVAHDATVLNNKTKTRQGQKNYMSINRQNRTNNCLS